MRYRHIFDVKIVNDFHSDIKDFDKAFDAWIRKFKDPEALRKRLLNTPEDTKSILEGIVFSNNMTVDLYSIEKTINWAP